MSTETLRPLSTIAREIMRECPPKARWAANPYLEAMRSLDTVSDTYGADDARSIILYALSNLTAWRGETARACKAELKQHLKQ